MIAPMARVSSRFWLWRLPAAVALGATLLFAGGFWLALRSATGSPLGQSPPAPTGGARPVSKKAGKLLLVLGDSLAHGTGDESGRGFAADVLDALRRRGPVEIANLSVNGAESPEIRDLVEKDNVRSLAASADWILVSVGGNDLSHAIPRGETLPAAPAESLSRARDRYASNLRAILGRLREANPSAPIRVLGLYDPFETPNAGNRLGESVILGWNHLIQETALGYSETLVVPTFDLFEFRQDRLALDHFHPNRAAYSLIATRILQGLPE
jgi:lysophospholipase L1-like esterase